MTSLNTTITTAPAAAGMINVRIPFEGYYSTVLGSMLEDAENSFCEYYRENPSEFLEFHTPADCLDKMRRYIDEHPDFMSDLALWMYSDTSDLQTAINKEWAVRFFEGIDENYDIAVDYDIDSLAMYSPREYNFYTDELYINADKAALIKLYEQNKEICAEYIHERMARRDGFIPFYSNDISDWGNSEDWDCAQWGLVLESLFFDSFRDWVIDMIYDNTSLADININTEKAVRDLLVD